MANLVLSLAWHRTGDCVRTKAGERAVSRNIKGRVVTCAVSGACLSPTETQDQCGSCTLVSL
jgi:hypothetical protein